MSEISKQLAIQHRYLAKGLCRACGKLSIFKAGLCLFHYNAALLKARNQYRKRVGIPLDAPKHSHYRKAAQLFQ